MKNDPSGPDEERRLGTFVHIAAWEELATAAGCTDRAYLDQFWEGLPILGPTVRSGLWPALDETPEMTIEELDQRAWEIREDQIRRAERDVNAIRGEGDLRGGKGRR